MKVIEMIVGPPYESCMRDLVLDTGLMDGYLVLQGNIPFKNFNLSTS